VGRDQLHVASKNSRSNRGCRFWPPPDRILYIAIWRITVAIMHAGLIVH
jgi:hypothetical protein